MLFLNTGVRHTAISGMGMRNQSYTNKMGHSFIICGCLSLIIGLILIVIGVISEVKKTTFIGIGVISTGIGFFLTTLVCFYGKLDTCYNNWAYRSRVLPLNHETRRPTPTDAISNYRFVQSPAAASKRQSILIPAPFTVTSDIEIHKIISAQSITTNYSAHVT
jgi:hypothetical protein